MRVPSCHRQTLVPQQGCNIFKRSALHSQTARKRVPQVVPPKVLDPSLNHRVVEPMAPILKWRSSFFRLEHTPLPIAPCLHNPEGGYGSNV